jgi:hypothetical protein
VVTNDGITINAPPDDVWPWLVQMGWGWYTARWVDRLLFPANGPSATTIVPDLQGLKVGDSSPTVRRAPTRGSSSSGWSRTERWCCTRPATSRRAGAITVVPFSTGHGSSPCRPSTAGAEPGTCSAPDGAPRVVVHARRPARHRPCRLRHVMGSPAWRQGPRRGPGVIGTSDLRGMKRARRALCTMTQSAGDEDHPRLIVPPDHSRPRRRAVRYVPAGAAGGRGWWWLQREASRWTRWVCPRRSGCVVVGAAVL